MRQYSHLTLSEREDVMCLRREGRNTTEIARAIGRHKSTVSRELKRNSCARSYRASTAQARYEERRGACARPRILDDPAAYELVRDKFLGEQWSPEQIEGRLRLEGSALRVSDTTIYREIRAGRFDGELPGRKKASRRLRRRGKRRRGRGGAERRGRIRVSHEIGERPAEAEDRSRLGDWEADTVAGKAGGACLVTSVDRRSGYLVGGRAARKASDEVGAVMRASLAGQPLETVTSDRGKEFACHAGVTAELGVEFYFCAPHCPWQRGTNENTNGLLREYFPKGADMAGLDDGYVQEVYDKLNRRPRKRLGYRTPREVHFSEVLHLV